MTKPLRPYRQCHLRGALCCTDSDRRKDAYRVLALLMTLVTGTTGIAAEACVTTALLTEIQALPPN